MTGHNQLKIDENFSNQNFYIDYYIIYTNIQKNFYKLHLEKYDSCYKLLFISRILLCAYIWFILRIKIN